MLYEVITLGERDEQVDDLDAGFEQLNLGGLLGEGRSLTVNGHPLLAGNLAQLVHRSADNVHDAAQRTGTDGNGDRRFEVSCLHAANETFGSVV